METSTAGVANYIGTLIFCIVVKGVSIIILLLLLTELGQQWQFTLLTIETCMILIVLYALYRIQKYEAEILKKYNDSKKLDVKLDRCPDYYVKSLKDNEIICSSVYDTPQSKYVYDMAPSSQALKEINLTKIGLDGKNKIENICQIMEAGEYNRSIAWTDLKTRC